MQNIFQFIWQNGTPHLLHILSRAKVVQNQYQNCEALSLILENKKNFSRFNYKSNEANILFHCT